MRKGHNEDRITADNPKVRIRTLVRKIILELEQIERQMYLSDFDSDVKGLDYFEKVRRFEAQLITIALFRSHGHQGSAATLLNIGPSTLSKKIKEHNINWQAFRKY